MIYRGAMYVALINPYTENREEALRFLEYAALHPSDVERLYMYPSAADPVEDSSYRVRLEEWTARRDALTAALETCEEEQKKDLQAQLEEHLKRQSQIEGERYLISTEDITAWQEAMEHMVFLPPSIYDLNEELFIELEYRYLDGELSKDAFLTELERIARMLSAESAE